MTTPTAIVAARLIDDSVRELKSGQSLRLEKWVKCPACSGVKTALVIVTRNRPDGAAVVRAACKDCSWYAMT